MDAMISRFTDQLEEAIQIGQAATINPYDGIQNILVCGLGGSGIGGDYLSEFIRSEAKVPVTVSKRYHIPAFASENTLAIVSSYSGNTEETLMSMDALETQGCHIVCIASGGKIIDRAKNKDYDYIQVPNNWASPRACMGYSIVQQLYIVSKLGIISNAFEGQLKASIDLIKKETEDIKEKAEKIAHMINDKTCAIYSTDRLAPVALRFRQQINENAKYLCWHHQIPEMNHNELVGWKDMRNDVAAIVLRDKDDFSRNQTRIDINKTIISELAAAWIEIYAKGNSLIEKSFYLVHLVDWVSWYLSDIRKMDAVEVKVIDFLKGELAKS